jgi:NADH-quinone oxidoreductase subunit N
MVAYALTTLGAFGVVALVKNEDVGGTDLDSFAGLGFARPWVGLAMAVFMFSLGGIPPTAGFVGKFYIFGGAIREGFITLAVIGVLNSVLSMVYYLRVVVAMYMRPADATSHLIPANGAIGTALVLAVAGILFFGVYPGPLFETAQAAVRGLGF